MRRRFATLMAAAVFALGVGAVPVMADSRDGHHGDGWTVVASDTQNLGKLFKGTDMRGMLNCSSGHRTSTYTVVSGFEDQVQMTKGLVGVETWTLRDAKVRSVQTDRIYRVSGGSRIVVTYAADQVTPISATFTQNVQIEGTRDGRSFLQDAMTWPMVMIWDRGTCASLQMGMN